MVWVTIAGSIAAWLAVVVALWRTRAGGGLPEYQVQYLLGELIEDFDELAALGAEHAEWFVDSDRRDRELRLARLHARLADDGAVQQVAVCRAAYLACWALSSAGSSIDVDTELSEATRRGSAAAASALERISAR